MTTIQKISNNKIILKNNDLTINTIFKEGKIWLTKKELAKLYSTTKPIIKEQLKGLIKNSSKNKSDLIKKIYNKKIGKVEKFISLDLIILLGYKLRNFSETKSIINSNNLIKNYSLSRKYRFLSTYKDNFLKYFQTIRPIFSKQLMSK